MIYYSEFGSERAILYNPKSGKQYVGRGFVFVFSLKFWFLETVQVIGCRLFPRIYSLFILCQTQLELAICVEDRHLKAISRSFVLRLFQFGDGMLSP
jgi:hypothetical protein